ncbi:hypothetical protein QNE37_001763 [Vibrio vulnificus]|nr:hypothetical protein [Vibrio vulnificus]
MVMQVGNSLIPLELVPSETQVPLPSQFSGFDDLLHGFDHFGAGTSKLNPEVGTTLEGAGNTVRYQPDESVLIDHEGSLIDHIERIKADRHFQSPETKDGRIAEDHPIAERAMKTPGEDDVKVPGQVTVEEDIQHFAPTEGDALLTPLSLNMTEKAAAEIGAQRGNYLHRLKATGTMDNILAAVQSQPTTNGNPPPLEPVKAGLFPLADKPVAPLYRVPFEPLSQQRKTESVNTHFFQVDSAKTKEAKEKSMNKLLFSNRLPLTEEIAKSFIKTVSNPDKIRVYYRDYTGITDGRMIQQMIDVLHRNSGKPVALTYNGKTEVFYGSTASQ